MNMTGEGHFKLSNWTFSYYRPVPLVESKSNPSLSSCQQKTNRFSHNLQVTLSLESESKSYFGHFFAELEFTTKATHKALKTPVWRFYGVYDALHNKSLEWLKEALVEYFCKKSFVTLSPGVCLKRTGTAGAARTQCSPDEDR